MNMWFLMGVAFLTFVGYMLSNFIAGTQFGATEVDLMNHLMAFKVVEVVHWSVPILNIDFFVYGMRAIFAWDFSFLEGSYILWFLYILNIGMAFGLATLFLNFVSRFIPSR